MTPQQVLTPAQCHPMGDPGGLHGYGVCLRQERGGEPAEREQQGARPLSHPGVCGEHGGGGGLHAVLHQRYYHRDAVLAHAHSDLRCTNAQTP